MDWYLMLAAFLLVPLVYLFRFVGCKPGSLDYPVDDHPDESRPLAVDLRLIFYPDPGDNGNDYLLEISFDPVEAGQATETVTWPSPMGEALGTWGWHPSDTEEPRRLRYLLTPTILEGDHHVTCRVFAVGEAEPRWQGECPGLVALASDHQRIVFSQGPAGPEAPFLAWCAEED